MAPTPLGEGRQPGPVDRTGPDRVWAVDYQHPWPMDKLSSFAERYDSAYIAYRDRWLERTQALRDSASAMRLGEMLRSYNRPELLAHIQAIRVRAMEVDARGAWVGLEPNISFWTRNMRIFADVALHAQPGERVFVVYGLGHAYFFRKWALQHPGSSWWNRPTVSALTLLHDGGGTPRVRGRRLPIPAWGGPPPARGAR